MHTIIMIIAFIISYFFGKTKTTETFVPSFNRCRAKGYSKEFCLQTPWSSNICRCPNGMIGKRLPGFRGACVCHPTLLL